MIVARFRCPSLYIFSHYGEKSTKQTVAQHFAYARNSLYMLHSVLPPAMSEYTMYAVICRQTGFEKERKASARHMDMGKVNSALMTL